METLQYGNSLLPSYPNGKKNKYLIEANHIASQDKQRECLMEGMHKGRNISSKIPEVLMKGHLKRSGPMKATAIDRTTTTLL